MGTRSETRRGKKLSRSFGNHVMVVNRVIGLTLAFVCIWNANHMQAEIVQKDVKLSYASDVIGI
jgi:hypothetical protein